MYQEKVAELNNVDFLLDIKLDIIFNSEEIVDLDKSDMERMVNYAEEEIRSNLQNYRLLYDDWNNLIGVYAVNDYEDGKIVDTLYVMQDYRAKGIGTYILNKIINDNYLPLYLFVYKSNKDAISLYKKLGFEVAEESQYRYLFKNKNEKEQNKKIKIKMFYDDVEKLSKKYQLKYKFSIDE